MEAGAINFGGGQASGDTPLGGASPLAINVLTDGTGAVRRRPGISAWSAFPTAIPAASEVQGIHEFEGEVYYVNAFREVRKVTAAGVESSLSGGVSTSYLAGSGRPVFAVTPYRLVIAGGAAPEKVDSGETAAERLGGSPPDSEWIAHMSSRLFSNDLASRATSNHLRFSGPGAVDEESWDALDFGSAESEPDAVVAGRTTGSEIWAFGTRSLEIFSPDPISVVAPGRAWPLGCSAAHSVIRVDTAFAWLDNQRRFVLSDGRSYDEISGPIAATLDDITTVSDCFGYRVNMGQVDCLVWTFPTDGRSFCYQVGGGWSQWHGWTAGVGHSLFPVKCHRFFEADTAHLVGLATGQIAKFDAAAYTDLGGTIKAEAWTGFLNRGTAAHKHCAAVRFTVKRGQAATAPVLLYSFRDEEGAAFCSPISIDLGTTGDYVSTVEVRGLGTYRQRQHKLEMTDAVDIVVAGVEEEWN